MGSYGGRKVGRLRRMVWDNYEHTCHWCKRPVQWETFTVEHLLPRGAGGTHELSNLRPACGSRKNGGCGENFARGSNMNRTRRAVDNTDFFS